MADDHVRCPNYCFNGKVKSYAESRGRALFDMTRCPFCKGAGTVSPERAREIEKEI